MNFKFQRNPQDLLEQLSAPAINSIQAEASFLGKLQNHIELKTKAKQPLRPFLLVVGGFMDQYLGHGVQVAQELKTYLPHVDIYFREYYEVEAMLHLIKLYAQKCTFNSNCKILQLNYSYPPQQQSNCHQNNSQLDDFQVHGAPKKYFSQDTWNLERFAPNNLQPNINLIGHSWGGNAVINALVPRLNIPLNVVITLDPVSYQGPPKHKPLQIIHWFNSYVDYQHTRIFNKSNLIARIGSPWQKIIPADVNTMASQHLNHAQAWPLLQCLDLCRIFEKINLQ